MLDAIFEAGAGSEALGKMDLLTVIIHEMGHVLGLPDQVDHPDYLMANTLRPGIRRLPSPGHVDSIFEKEDWEEEIFGK